jgi:glycosyltransferase involved in cell wall biosynthesis
MDKPLRPLDFYVLIPCFNNLAGLLLSLKSISYDPSRYGVLVVDDGSKEPITNEDLISCLPQNLEVKILSLEKNQGITKALNTGLDWLENQGRSRYVARLDCGDLCADQRFTRQIEFMDSHPDIDMVGSWCIFKDFNSGFSFRYTTPTEHTKIIRGMYFKNVFRHSTVLWRSGIVQKTGSYPETFPHAEDYGFFYQILNKGKAAILPEYLVICEINADSISVHNRREQLRSRGRVVRQYGKNRLLSLFGTGRLWLLRVIPYKLILEIKGFLYGIKRNTVI